MREWTEPPRYIIWPQKQQVGRALLLPQLPAICHWREGKGRDLLILPFNPTDGLVILSFYSAGPWPLVRPSAWQSDPIWGHSAQYQFYYFRPDMDVVIDLVATTRQCRLVGRFPSRPIRHYSGPADVQHVVHIDINSGRSLLCSFILNEILIVKCHLLVICWSSDAQMHGEIGPWWWVVVFNFILIKFLFLFLYGVRMLFPFPNCQFLFQQPIGATIAKARVRQDSELQSHP